MEAATPPAAVEVNPAEALGEGVDQAPAPRPRPGGSQATEEVSEQLNVLTSKKGAKQWQFGKDNDGKPVLEYVQRELSVLTKAQWFSLAGEFLERTLGEVSLNTLFSPPDSVRTAMQSGGEGQFRPQDIQDADTFVQAIGKLLVRFPGFLEDSVCIWLDVPDYEHELAKEWMRKSPELGGLSDANAFEMIEIFIDQNYEAIRENFRERFSLLRERWEARTKEYDESHSRKR